jgi:DNA-binding NarL/FixJ family response regulator
MNNASTVPGAVPGKYRVFLVDDHPIVRRGFQLLISQESDLIVCGEADSGPTAFEKILQTKPDVAIVDLTLKTSSGLELIKQLHINCPKLKVLVFSMRDEGVYAERALRAGAHGYITKEEGTEKAIDAIRVLMTGKRFLSERMSARMMDKMLGGGSQTDGALDALSDREMEVLELIGTGSSSRQIADRLHLSIKTVESHREHLKSKLGLKRSSELVNYAFTWAHEQNQDNKG